MKARIYLFTILLSLLITNRIHSQETSYIFRHIGATEGLPDNYIGSVFSLPDGRMGIRTVLLTMYDGANFTNFPFDFQKSYPIQYNHIIFEQYIDADNRLWMKERAGLQVFDLTTEQYIYNVDSLLHQLGFKEKLADIVIDSEKRYWFLTDSSSVYAYDQRTKTVGQICRDNEAMNYYGKLLGIESHGNYSWMVHQNGIIRCYDHEKERFIEQLDFLKDQLKPDDRIILKILDNGDFWIMWDRGAGYYDVYKKKWNPIAGIRLGQNSWFTSMDVDKGGNAWIGTVLDGICVVDIHNFSVTQLRELPLLSGKTIINGIQSIYCDRESGAVWVGLYNQGMCYYHPSLNRMKLYNKKVLNGDWNGEEIRCMLETSTGEILMGTTQALYRYEPETRSLTKRYKEFARKNCRMLYEDSKERIWVGTYHDGLYCIENGKVRAYDYPDTDYQNELDYSNIRAMVEDKAGRLWVSIYGGVGQLNPENGEITLLCKQFPELKKHKVANALAIDNQSRLLVGSDNGLYVYDPDKNEICTLKQEGETKSAFNYGSMKCNRILKDYEGTLWFATQYGLHVLTTDGRSYTLGRGEGLSKAILNIQEDKNHDIWISTVTSIYKIKVERNTEEYQFHVISCLSEAEVLQDDLFSFSSLMTGNTMYLGLLNGFVTFSPDHMLDTYHLSRPLFTSFRLFNVPVFSGEKYNGRILFNKALGYSESVSLKYDENYVTLEFSGLNYLNPSQTSFRYQLDGFDKGWTEALFENGQGRITYNNLPPGEYVFRVSIAGNDRMWGPESKFVLVIHPPFWDTLAARIFYVILGILIIFGFIFIVNRRNHQKMIRMQQEEAQRQKEELEQMKFRFFTNISHELRTPLTLIITPLDTIIRRLTDEVLAKQLGSVYKNAQNLLTLVNQLLDFRKLEMKGEKLNLQHGDWVEFVRQAYIAFQEMADEKSISFQLDTNGMDELYMYFDRDKIHKVLNNLLSNAFKFTPESGNITLEIEKQNDKGRGYIQVKVIDTGVGISEEDLPHVFERFYQAKKNMGTHISGSGIGLHLIKEYVELHGGHVSVESILGAGSTFCITVPVDLHPEASPAPHLPAEEIKEGPVQELALRDGIKPLLLIVEDNKEFRLFLREQLSEWYNIIDAPDGEEGERLAVKQNPDLIISDIMMPNVDGIELCYRIKTNLQTSHIPVILLTARASDESKAMGYEAGADSYISKPFSIDVLLTRVRKLIEQQKKRQETFHKEIVVTPSNITITSLDEQLVQKALECVERNMDNTEYSVEELSVDLAMTRATLYRKLQGITGQTPKDFIRSIRLKRAAQLLRDTDLSISEIADHVGFSTPRYFAKLFKDTFGVLPSQYDDKSRESQS
ncbi:ATP-binding protein [Bacteroides ovatus]|uniref:hybrid sensor histidine kinase/response regulator n=1 Tax=Bacteroides ovatus TaxID=28116 RepID=UPI0031451DE6